MRVREKSIKKGKGMRIKKVMTALPGGPVGCALLSVLVLGNSATGASAAQSDASEANGDAQKRAGRTRSLLEEVLVTATRRQESLQNVPIAISTLSTAEMERQGIETFEDFARQMPGVSFNKVSKNLGTFAVRGIAVNTTAGAGLQNTTAVYIGDVPITSSSFITPDVRLFDIERVEVLRGPQGTLFGSGSLSGTVRIIPNQAEFNEFDAKIRVDGGVTDGDALRQRYDAMVNIPLIDDTLALRAVAYVRDEDGWIDNLGTGKDNANGTEDWGVRASIRWQPTDRFSSTLMIMHDESKPLDSSFIDTALGKNQVDTIVPGGVFTKLTNYNLSLAYKFDWATLEVSTTYTDFQGDYDQDNDAVLAGIFPGFVVSTRNNAPAIVQETRLVSTSDSRLQWTVGSFYMDRRADIEEFRYTSPDFLANLNITGLENGVFFRTSQQERDDREVAAFGELSYDVTDQLTATVGLRYSSYRRELTRPFSFNQTGALVGAVRRGGNVEIPPPTVTDLGVIGPDTFDELSSKFALSWQPADNTTYYLSAAQGFRVPIPNSNAGADSVSQIDPNDLIIPDSANGDNLWNFEIGMKADWLGGTLRTNIAAFYIPWENIQTLGIRPSDGIRFFANAGDAEVFGLEVELLANPSDNLEFGLSLTMQKAEIVSLTEQEAAFSGAVEGSKLTTPDFKLAGFAQYSWMLAEHGSMYLRADVQHVSSYPNTQPNTVGRPNVPDPQFTELSAYENVNASLGWVLDKVTVVLYGENLLDNDDIIARPPSSVIGTFATLRPRTIGLRATWAL